MYSERATIEIQRFGPNTKRKLVNVGTLYGKKEKILDIEEMKTNIIIDTESEYSIARTRYHAEMKLPELDSHNVSLFRISGKVIKLVDLFLHKVRVDDIDRINFMWSMRQIMI